MARIIRYVKHGASRFSRVADSGERPSHLRIHHTARGEPMLQVSMADAETGRIYDIDLSPEDTAVVMRMMLRSGAAGMEALRDRFAPQTEAA